MKNDRFIYIKALRLPFLAGSLIPLITASVFCYYKGTFAFYPFFTAMLGVSALHLGSNLFNDYFDAPGTDSINRRITPFSGGSRVIQDHKVQPSSILALSMLLFLIGILCGLLFYLNGRPYVLLIGLFGLFAGLAYSAPPIKLMSVGLGEIFIFFAFGPFITLGTSYVITGILSWSDFLLGIPHGFFIMAVIWINEFPDYQADHDSKKRNIVVRLGLSKARYFYGLIMLLPFFFVILLVLAIGFPYAILLSLVAIPLSMKAIYILWDNYMSYKNLIPAQALTIITMTSAGLLISAGLFISKTLGI
ncbi:MAG: prenyltransferase [Deltaproteobacteria bacterium]|nr:prenyltransferase [Deltaproteobacteria bacterium]